jgi:hypothetical protein
MDYKVPTLNMVTAPLEDALDPDLDSSMAINYFLTDYLPPDRKHSLELG